MAQQQWFESWFDTPYYHILYQNRDESEAHFFIDNLVDYLQPAPLSTVLDLGCGKGRHSIYLAQKNLDVTGVDLSQHNILHARQFENPHLSFFTQDMRTPFRTNYFDYILNVFTSFGFFDNDRDHLQTLHSIFKGLHRSGTFVLDFLNLPYVEKTLIEEEKKEIDGILFHIHRFIKNGFIYKNIYFEADGQDWQFTERVRGFDQPSLTKMFEKAGFRIQTYFGDYALSPYQGAASNRLILVAKKQP